MSQSTCTTTDGSPIVAWRYCDDGFGVDVLVQRKGYGGNTNEVWELFSTGSTTDDDAAWLMLHGVPQETRHGEVFKDGSTFKDSSNNVVRELLNDYSGETCKYGYGFRVIELVNEPGHGYITDACGEIYPGPCLTWYGPGERYPDAKTACDETAQWENENQG